MTLLSETLSQLLAGSSMLASKYGRRSKLQWGSSALAPPSSGVDGPTNGFELLTPSIHQLRRPLTTGLTLYTLHSRHKLYRQSLCDSSKPSSYRDIVAPTLAPQAASHIHPRSHSPHLVNGDLSFAAIIHPATHQLLQSQCHGLSNDTAARGRTNYAAKQTRKQTPTHSRWFVTLT